MGASMFSGPRMLSTLYYSCLSKLLQANDRRKFRSQNSDNMHRWKAEMGRAREENRREEKRRESQKKEAAGARRGRKVPKHCVFPVICGSGEGRKLGSLNWRVRSHLARWEMKNFTPLWREANSEVNIYKTPQLQSTCGGCDSNKVRPAVARSKLPRQKCKNGLGALLAVEMLKKMHAITARSTCPSQSVKSATASERAFGSSDVEKVREHMSKSRCRNSEWIWGVWSTLRRSDVLLAWQSQGIAHVVKVSKTWKFCSSFTKDGSGRRGSGKIPLVWQAQYKKHMS